MCYPDDATRVKLDDRDDGESNYINANYISVSVIENLMYALYCYIKSVSNIIWCIISGLWQQPPGIRSYTRYVYTRT